MDRFEGTGFGIALIGHAALFGLLSANFLGTPDPREFEQQPIEVSLAGEIALESSSPMPDAEVPAARLSPVDAPLEEDSPAEAPDAEPEPAPQPRPQPPAPAPVPDPRPAEKAQPRRPTPPQPRAESPPRERPRRPTGRLDGIVGGVSEERSTSNSTTPPATNIGPAVQSALSAEIIRQIRPHWDPPFGADTDQLRTTVEVRLNRDGTIQGTPRVVRQTGVNASNRAQADLARERAVRAVQLAAPFRLPPQFYDAWQRIAPTLYEDL